MEKKMVKKEKEVEKKVEEKKETPEVFSKCFVKFFCTNEKECEIGKTNQNEKGYCSFRQHKKGEKFSETLCHNLDAQKEVVERFWAKKREIEEARKEK